MKRHHARLQRLPIETNHTADITGRVTATAQEDKDCQQDDADKTSHCILVLKGKGIHCLFSDS